MLQPSIILLHFPSIAPSDNRTRGPLTSFIDFTSICGEHPCGVSAMHLPYAIRAVRDGLGNGRHTPWKGNRIEMTPHGSRIRDTWPGDKARFSANPPGSWACIRLHNVTPCLLPQNLRGWDRGVGIYTRYHPSRDRNAILYHVQDARTDIFLFRISILVVHVNFIRDLSSKYFYSRIDRNRRCFLENLERISSISVSVRATVKTVSWIEENWPLS